MLRFLGIRGLYPGALVLVRRIEPWGGSWHLEVDRQPVSIGRELTRHIYLSAEE
jgi:Fe2+ transport system protein FeoA